MNVFVLLLAVMLNGEIEVLEYSANTGKAVEFATKEACERKNTALRRELPKILPADVTLVDQVCVPRPARGGV